MPQRSRSWSRERTARFGARESDERSRTDLLIESEWQSEVADAVVDRGDHPLDEGQRKDGQRCELVCSELEPQRAAGAARVARELLPEALVGDEAADGLFDGALGHARP